MVYHSTCLADIDFRGKNLLITFDDKPLTVKALLALEESSNGKQLRSKLVLEEPESNGGAVIYSQCPVAIIPLGAQVELSKMKIKIADFGCGTSFTLWRRLKYSKHNWGESAEIGSLWYNGTRGTPRNGFGYECRCLEYGDHGPYRCYCRY